MISILYFVFGFCAFMVTVTLIFLFLFPIWAVSMPVAGLIYLCKGVNVVRRLFVLAQPDLDLPVPDEAFYQYKRELKALNEKNP